VLTRSYTVRACNPATYPTSSLRNEVSTCHVSMVSCCVREMRRLCLARTGRIYPSSGGARGCDSPGPPDRPGRSPRDAVAACRKRCWKTDWSDRFGHQKFFDRSSPARPSAARGSPVSRPPHRHLHRHRRLNERAHRSARPRSAKRSFQAPQLRSARNCIQVTVGRSVRWGLSRQTQLRATQVFVPETQKRDL
jgi:hypothetical protein